MAERQGFITLYELNSRVREVIEGGLPGPVWVQAELSEVREHGGHCYVECIEKHPASNVMIAKCSGVIWKNNWTLLKPYFEQVTSQPLSPGMQVLVQVEVSFHELYGYKLNILNIDPAYTVGDITRRRKEILRQLEQEGVINMNKSLPMPVLLQRIAVISSQTAAGWGDFQNQLLSNQYGLAFDVRLFPAVMQGDNLEASVIAALNDVAADSDNWDVVVIIRGGGAVSDLIGFDSLRLAEHVAQFPLPVITGIGHERDDTVIDMIAHTRVKTPTAAAEFIISHQFTQLQLIAELADRMANGTNNLLVGYQRKMENLQIRFGMLARQYLSSKKHQLDLLSNRLPYSRLILQKQLHRLELITARLEVANPDHLLNLGYAIVRHEGKAVKDAASLPIGSNISITFAKGTAQAILTEQP